MQAMILAAGLGTRLRPYSLTRPKPLFPVLNRPLLLHIIRQLREAGCELIVINTFHLNEQIADLVKGESDIILQEEKSILGTGGGLRKATENFSNGPLLVVNGDIVHNIDLHGLIRQHAQTGLMHPVNLVMHDFPRFNSVVVDHDHRILSFDANSSLRYGERLLAFTGIHIIDPQILSHIPADIFYNIIDCYTQLIKKGIPIYCLEERDHFWLDIGTPEDYLKLHAHFLISPRQGLYGGPPVDSPFLIDRSAHVGDEVLLNDWACIGARAIIGDGAVLSRVVVWEGARIPPKAILQDAIVT